MTIALSSVDRTPDKPLQEACRLVEKKRGSQERTLKPGQAVRWPRETGRDVWTFKGISPVTGMATVTRVQGGQKRSRLAPPDQLEPIGGHLRRQPPTEIPWFEDALPRKRPRRERVRLADIEKDEAPDIYAPIRPRRRVDELADSIHFSVGCLEHYMRRYARRTPWPEIEDRIEQEVRRGDFIEPGPRSDLYGSIVTKRFAIRLERQPTADDPLLVEVLFPLRERGRKAA